MDADIHFVAPPTVYRFLRSDAFVRAMVGPVGSGKSSGCVIELGRRASDQQPGPDGVRRTRFAVIRNTYSQLRDTTRKTFEQWIPQAHGHWHEQSFTYVIDSGEKGQRVHSEILFRALDRPEDVKKLLSLELTGAYVNEAREVPKTVLDVLQTRVGRFPSKAQGGPTWFGIWMDTNPWPTTHWGYQLFSKQKLEGFELFEQPSGLSPEAENVANLPQGYYQRLCIGKDAEWIAEYLKGEYPSSDRGSIYGHLVSLLEARGGLAEFEHPSDGIFTTWDLGISDATSIWFWRLGKGVEFVDHYSNHGQPLSHFFDELAKRSELHGYKYLKHWLPHDARARTLSTGTTILEQFADKYGSGAVAIGPALSLLDGLQAGRWLLEQPGTRFHPRCGPGIDALRAYKYEFDEDTKSYSRKPLHDWSSHDADAFRYSAVVVKVSELLTRKEEKPKPRPINTKPPTVDEMLAELPRATRERI